MLDGKLGVSIKTFLIFVSRKTHMEHNKETKRVQVSFTEEQWDLIEKFKGNMGNTDADAVRNIVISWLAEKSFISTAVKREMEDG